ncbi:MAG: peptide-methionine (R)-S-oxide reductase [Pseudomonadota bacterium]
MKEFSKDRRQLMTSSLLLGAGSVLPAQTFADSHNAADKFVYEVVRSDAEWRAMFDDETYKILRLGDTEWPRSSKWWDDFRDGHFSCVGCGLPNYDSIWRARVDKGWVFFHQSRPDALLMGIDGEAPDGMSDDKSNATIEAHCRRCGSHMGHILKVNGEVLHCINGKALDFTPQSA